VQRSIDQDPISESFKPASDRAKARHGEEEKDEDEDEDERKEDEKKNGTVLKYSLSFIKMLGPF